MSPRKNQKWLVAVSVTFGTLMGAIDSSIVNVGLSQIRGAVGATVQEITWISTGFSIAMVMVMPLTGFFGRLFGQKNVYLACLALFIAGSALCGVAWSLPSLVIFRAIQGFGAGALQPTEQAILRQTFPPEEQATAMALFTMAVMIGPALGPTLGGFIVDNFHWSWIFFINVPVGILGFFMVSRFVHEPEDLKEKARVEAEKQRRHMDWLGIALLWTSLIALQYVLEEGQSDGWFESPWIVVVSLVSVFAMAAFIVCELTAVAPAVNLRLFRDRTYTIGTLTTAGTFGVMMAGMFLLPLFMQELLGLTATQSGMALMPRTLVMFLAMPVAARLYRYSSPAVLGAAGLLVTAYGQLLLSNMTLDSNAGHVVFALMFQGVGMSLMLVPLQTVALSTIPRERLADATGLSSLLRQIGGSFGIAAFATILSRTSVGGTAAVRAHLVLERPEVQARLVGAESSLLARGMDVAAAHAGALASFAGAVARQGMVLAFEHLFAVGAICFALVLPLVVSLRRPAQPASAPVHVEVE